MHRGHPQKFDTLVTGATGLIGRWLTADLTSRGRRVVALVRNAAPRTVELIDFVDRHGGDGSRVHVVEGDLGREDLGLTEEFEGVRDVFHCAALYAWNLDAKLAHHVNVLGSVRVARWAATRGDLRRLVYLGGYRMTRLPAWVGTSHPLVDKTRRRLYRELGAYEASKVEAQFAVKAAAKELGVPLTIISPSTVTGDSRTGETTQRTGLGESIRLLWKGAMPANAGSDHTFVPLIPVDYLARVMATVVDNEATVGQELTVLDPGTPTLPKLMTEVAAHLGVPAPGITLPVGVVRALPERVSGVVRETLSFLSEDRYDTTTAEAHADRMGLALPDGTQSTQRWVEHLVSTRFGEAPQAQPGRFVRAAQSQTFTVGDARRADVVFLHGLPWDGESWHAVCAALKRTSARPDLPGLGRSSASQGDRLAWLQVLLADREHPVWLVGHSLGSGLAVRYAAAHPQRVAGVVMVSPFFLQGRPPALLRCATIGTLAMRNPDPEALQSRLLGRGTAGEAVRSAAAQLSRKGVAARTARALAGAARKGERDRLRQLLASLTVPHMAIVGANDPLRHPYTGAVVTVAESGHNPHVSHAGIVASAVDAGIEELGKSAGVGAVAQPSTP